MLEITQDQLNKIMSRQRYLDQEILGSEPDSKEYVLSVNGGWVKFYNKWLWEYLGLKHLCDESEQVEFELNGEFC